MQQPACAEVSMGHVIPRPSRQAMTDDEIMRLKEVSMGHVIPRPSRPTSMLVRWCPIARSFNGPRDSSPFTTFLGLDRSTVPGFNGPRDSSPFTTTSLRKGRSNSRKVSMGHVIPRPSRRKPSAPRATKKSFNGPRDSSPFTTITLAVYIIGSLKGFNGPRDSSPFTTI